MWRDAMQSRTMARAMRSVTILRFWIIAFAEFDVAPQVLMLLLSCRCGMTAQPAGTIETGAGYSIMVCGELIWKPLIGDRVLLGQSA